MLRLSVLAALVASCSAPAPVPPDSSTVTVVDRLLALDRPYRADAVADALGVTLRETAASNDYVAVFESGDAAAPLASVEVREARPGHDRGGMVLAAFRDGCVTGSDLDDRVGPSDGAPDVPRPEAPADAPRYVTHPQPWGELRLGYDADGCLRRVVLDAM